MAVEKLGKRISTHRERIGITREELAERANLTPEFIEAVEEKEIYPSIGPLVKIARCLGVRLGTFMDDVQNQDPCIVRSNERTAELTMHSEGKQSPALAFHSLGKGKTDRHMEPFFITIQPETEDDKKLSSHEGEEFIIVIDGKLDVLYGKDRFTLEAGDSIYLNSIIPHHVGCAGDTPARIYAVLYFPE